MRKVSVAPQTEWAQELYAQTQSLVERIATPFSIPVDVAVVANGARHVAQRVPYPKGHPKRPLSLPEVRAKFLANASFTIPVFPAPCQ